MDYVESGKVDEECFVVFILNIHFIAFTSNLGYIFSLHRAKMKLLVEHSTNQFLPQLCQMHSNNPHGLYREHKS
jgi:hypothetical protein